MTVPRLHATLLDMIRPLFAGSMLLLPTIAMAANITLIPTQELTYAEENRRIMATGTQALQLEGSGDRLVLSYTSAVPIDVDLAPMVQGSSYNPADLMHTTLPAGEDIVATVDLTRTAAWHPWRNRYFAGFFVQDRTSDVTLRSTEILPSRFGATVLAAMRHLGQGETFHVTAPHSLRGYLLLGVPLSLLLGLLTLFAALLYWRRGTSAVLLVALLSTLVYGLRWNVDLLKFSVQHLWEWETQSTYAIADSAYTVAEELRAEAGRGRTPHGLSVCTRSTNFVAKLLHYALYPLPVSVRSEDAGKSSHVLVKQMNDWSYEGGILRCGQLQGPATLIRTFEDGSVLFTSST